MIVYKNSKINFLNDTTNYNIADIIQSRLNSQLATNVQVGGSEYRSWQNSLQYMANVLRSDLIPENAGVVIEYNIPWSNNRVDFIISGKNKEKIEHAVLIELKQWQLIQKTDKDAIVQTHFQGRLKETLHPSYQAWSYADILTSFNKAVIDENIQLKPCACLHNYINDGIINNSFYSDYILKAPLFLKEDIEKLRTFISTYIHSGDTDDIIFKIENGKVTPSKALADSIVNMLSGNKEFTMIDGQKLAFEEIFAISTNSTASKKNVIIVNGGPGTGKSVVAINLLTKLIQKRLLATYVTRNSAPRIVYAFKLTGTLLKSTISKLFKGSGAFTKAPSNFFDVILADEAHRLNEKSGMFKSGENQVKEIINAAKCAVFFIDENQRVMLSDIGSKTEIEKWAKFYSARVHTLNLTAQFRCGGSNQYLSWLDVALQINNETTCSIFNVNQFEFKIFEDPNKLRDAIYKKNEARNKARIVAGYCWDWKGKKNKEISDITIPEHNFEMKWNFLDHGMTWIINNESVTEAGCIYTCQGLEVDYIGVIVGPDLIVRNKIIYTDVTKHPGADKAVQTYKALLKDNPIEANMKFSEIIKNTYRTLMTRGMKGCYVYFVDKETEAYFKAIINTK